MKLRSGNSFEPTFGCSHRCEMWQGYCCSCQDTRPHAKQYIAYNKASYDDYSIVSRAHYYCPTCKTSCAQREQKKLNRIAVPHQPTPVKMNTTTTTTPARKTLRLFSDEKRIATAVLMKDKSIFQVYPTKEAFVSETAWKMHWEAKRELVVQPGEAKKAPVWSFTKTDTKTLPAGQYYIGDPCYALLEDIYDGVFGAQGYQMGFYSDELAEQFFLVGSTYAGDGCYRGSDGKKYPVDSGTIAIMPVKMSEMNKDRFFGNIHTFKNPVDCIFKDGIFTFKSAGKKIVIET